MGLVYIGLGGALGALSRYGLSGLIVRWSSGEGFPYATFAVNLLGCLLIGIVWGLSERFTFHDHLGLFLLTGFLAAFTTFSTFCYENVLLARAQEWKVLLMNICLSNLVGIALVGFGFWTVHALLKVAR